MRGSVLLERVTFVILLHLATRFGAWGHEVQYYDCTSPTELTRLNARTSCKEIETTPTEPEHYQLLQRIHEEKVDGFRCEMEVSEFALYCGSFSHQKFLKPPIIDKHEPISITQCRELVTSQVFHPPGSLGAKDVVLGGTTLLSVTAHGVIHAEGSVSCEGEKVRIGEELVDQVLDLIQYKITLLPETYIIVQGRMEAVGDHVRLPKKCEVNTGGCTTGSGTFIWDPILNKCPLRRVQQVALQKEGFLHVDTDRKLIFEIEEKVTTPFGCPTSAEVWLTSYPDIYLTRSTEFEQMDPNDVDVVTYSDNRLEYVEFNLEKAAAKWSTTVTSALCESKYATEGKILPVHERFGLRSGDALLLFNCEKKIGTVATPEQECFDAIRLENGLYVDVATRIAKQHASVRDCSVHFPTYLEKADGTWITISDVIRVVDPPKSGSLIEASKMQEHESFAQRGLYTAEEISSWESAASWGHFHDSVTSRVAQGVCLQEDGPCASTRTAFQGESTGYDLSRLMARAQALSPMHSVNVWIRDNVGYLCVIVLTLYTIQWGLTIVIAAWAWIKEGPGTAISSLVVACCTTPHLMQRVRRATARARTVQPRDRDDVMTEEGLELVASHQATLGA